MVWDPHELLQAGEQKLSRSHPGCLVPYEGWVQAWELFTPPTAGAVRPWLSNSEMSTLYLGSLLQITYLNNLLHFLSFTHLLEEHQAAKLAGPWSLAEHYALHLHSKTPSMWQKQHLSVVILLTTTYHTAWQQSKMSNEWHSHTQMYNWPSIYSVPEACTHIPHTEQTPSKQSSSPEACHQYDHNLFHK